MHVEQITKLQEAVKNAAETPGAFVEWIDDDESQHVVTGIVQRETEGPVASLSGGGFVMLCEADACDFRLVRPAVPCSCEVKPEQCGQT